MHKQRVFAVQEGLGAAVTHSCNVFETVAITSAACRFIQLAVIFDALLIREENNYAQFTSFGGTFPLSLIVDVQIKKDRPRTQLKTQLSPVTR